MKKAPPVSGKGLILKEADKVWQSTSKLFVASPQAPTPSNVLPFRARHPARAPIEIAACIFSSLRAGLDARTAITGEMPDLSASEIVAGFGLAHKILESLQFLLTDAERDDGGAA